MYCRADTTKCALLYQFYCKVMAEWPWRYRSRSLCVILHANDHLCLIWKESIQNCRSYRAEWNQYTPPHNNFVVPGLSWHNEKSETLKAGCAFSAILVKSPIWFKLFQLSKLYTFMMGNAIYFNIILSLSFVKGFVPACCPVCTRRRKICKHICHNENITDCTCISFTFFVEVKAHAHQMGLPPPVQWPHWPNQNVQTTPHLVSIRIHPMNLTCRKI